MLTDDEKALYFDVARGYSGQGGVLEIGPWLGSGTIQICRGLDASQQPWALTVVDRFRWSELYERRYPKIRLSSGDEFLSLFKSNLSSYKDKITPITAELSELPKALPAKGELELLYVDAPKSWSLLWAVLKHIGPSLRPGARLVFQDFLHITSRQLIWLLASVPELRMTTLVQNGTSAAFVAEGPVASLEGRVPASINALGGDDLVALWGQVKKTLPAERGGELAVGMALDLLQRDATEQAERVLDDGAIGKPWTPALIEEVERLIRYSDAKNKRPLIEIGVYLKANVRPRQARAVWALQRAEDIFTAPAATEELVSLDRKNAPKLAEALRMPTSGLALATRYAIHTPLDHKAFLRHLPIFDAAVRSGALIRIHEVAEHLRGDVVEFNATTTLHGVAARAFGARTYTGVVSGFDPTLRTYGNALPGVRRRTKTPIGDICNIMTGLSYASDASGLEPASADFAFAELGEDAETLERTLAAAARLLAPGGRFWLRWRNPYGWSGHGRAPRRGVDVDRSDSGQMEVLDWRHVKRLGNGRPRIDNVAAMLHRYFEIESWCPRMEDPAAILRISAKVFERYPELDEADFITASVTVTARPKSAEAAGQLGRPAGPLPRLVAVERR